MAGAGPASNDASHVSAPVSRSSRADSSALREASYSKAINSRASKSSGFELEDGGGHLGSEARAEETETGHWQHQQQGLLQAVSVRQATGAKIRLWLGLSRPGQQTIHLAAAHTHNHGRQGLAWACTIRAAAFSRRQAARWPQARPSRLGYGRRRALRLRLLLATRAAAQLRRSGPIHVQQAVVSRRQATRWPPR